MRGLLLTQFGALFCALTLLGSRGGGLIAAGAVARAPRSIDDAAAENSRLRIGAFNIQIFGVSKVGKVGVLPILVDVSFNSVLF